jgi:hypothetical protein
MITEQLSIQDFISLRLAGLSKLTRQTSKVFASAISNQRGVDRLEKFIKGSEFASSLKRLRLEPSKNTRDCGYLYQRDSADDELAHDKTLNLLSSILGNFRFCKS